MLVDPETGRLTAVAQRALRARAEAEAEAGAVRAQDGDEDAPVEAELFLQQIETSTPPCTGSEELLTGIRDGRAAVGKAAAAVGARAVAMAVPVLRQESEDFTPETRYQRISAEYGELARQALTTGMHVHVGVESDDEGVRVMDAIRPWLPLLTALSGNSPFWHGRDTRHASWRSQIWGRWPTAGANEPFGDVATYRAVADRMTGWGAGLDPGMLYFDARLSTAYPTVEIRVADTCTDIDDALVVVALARALVETIARESGPADPLRSDLVRAAAWRASRHGLAGDLVDPRTWELVDAFQALDGLVDHVQTALDEAGDTDRVRDALDRLRATGNGARRQRAAFERSGDLRAVVADLVERTAESARG